MPASACRPAARQVHRSAKRAPLQAAHRPPGQARTQFAYLAASKARDESFSVCGPPVSPSLPLLCPLPAAHPQTLAAAVATAVLRVPPRSPARPPHDRHTHTHTRTPLLCASLFSPQGGCGYYSSMLALSCLPPADLETVFHPCI